MEKKIKNESSKNVKNQLKELSTTHRCATKEVNDWKKSSYGAMKTIYQAAFKDDGNGANTRKLLNMYFGSCSWKVIREQIERIEKECHVGETVTVTITRKDGTTEERERTIKASTGLYLRFLKNELKARIELVPEMA